MKRLFNGLLFDTDASELIARYGDPNSYELTFWKAHDWSWSLYRSNGGRFFLHEVAKAKPQKRGWFKFLDVRLPDQERIYILSESGAFRWLQSHGFEPDVSLFCASPA